MKTLGNVISGIGMIGFILGSCGYDSNPVVCTIIAFAGLGLAFAGYKLQEGYVDYDKEK